MKLLYTFVCLLLFVFTTYCQDKVEKVASKTVLPKDTMVNRLLGYEKGKLIYKGQTYRKWTVKELKKIILYKPDSFLESNLDDYASLRTGAFLFKIGGGAMLGHTLYDMMYYEKLNGGLFAASIGITALGLLLQSSANSRLRDAINIYNKGILERKVSFSPLIYPSDYNRMNVGVALHF